ncbi:MAG: MFS transporter [Bacillota bacterium]
MDQEIRPRSLFGFTRNANLFLTSSLIAAAAGGISGVILTLYMLKIGLREDAIGFFISINSLAAGLASVPAGLVSDRLGRRRILLTGLAVSAAGSVALPFVAGRAALLGLAVLLGISGTLAGVAASPFLAENSSREERTRLFSVFSAGTTAVSMVFAWIAGILPRFYGRALVDGAESVGAYRWTLLTGAAFSLAAVGPLLFLRDVRPGRHTAGAPERPRRTAALFAHVRNPGLLARLALTSGLIGLGAGTFVPFLNVFLKIRFGASTAAIATVSFLAQGLLVVGTVLAPALSRRVGKVPAMAGSILVSVPFMLVLGFAPWFAVAAGAYLVRNTVMNMIGPVRSTFSMEMVDPGERATASSLEQMTWQLSWAVASAVSGQVISRHGYGPVFLAGAAIYVLAGVAYPALFPRAFVGRREDRQAAVYTPEGLGEEAGR